MHVRFEGFNKSVLEEKTCSYRSWTPRFAGIQLTSLSRIADKLGATWDVRHERTFESLMGLDQESLSPFHKDNRTMERMSNLSSLMTGNNLSIGQDPFSDGNLASLSQEIVQIRERNSRERSLPAMKIRTKSTEEVLRGFVVLGREVEIKKTFIGMPWAYSQDSLSNLKRSLQDMFVRKTHKGHYFLGRVVSEIYKIVSIHLILEDPEGHATMLSFYNYPTSFLSKVDVMRPIFPKGSVWAIREPTYKFALNNDNAMIRVDSPSDIVPVAFDDELLRDIRWSNGPIPRTHCPPPSVEQCRLNGAREFKAQKWLAAAVCYTDGLKLDEDSLIMRLNRSEAYIRLGWFTSALHDAEQAIKIGIEDASLMRKAIFRAAKSCYYLTDYERAIGYVDRLPEDKDCAEWKAKAKSRIRERDTGRYDWCALFRESQEVCPRPDVADFYGPVEVQVGGDYGIRGLFATRDVKVGELLLATQPIASYYSKDNTLHESEVFISLNLLTDQATDRSRPALIAAVAQKMWDNEELATLIQSMFAGPEGTLPCPFFPPTPSVKESASPLIHPLKSNVNIDISHIEGATSFNAFSLDIIAPPKFKYRPEDAALTKSGSALYGLASFCNHSCLPSARRVFYGTFATLRATRPIKKGDEITLEYMSGCNPLSERDKLSQWKFQCKCPLCVADRADGARECSIRERICRGWIPTAVTVHDAAIKLDQVKKTYSDTPERSRAWGSKPLLASAYHNYGHVLGKKAIMGDRRSCVPSIEAEMNGLEATGMRITDRSTSGPFTTNRHRLPIDATIGPSHQPEHHAMAVLQIVAAFEVLGDSNRAENWMRVASWLNDIEAGGGSKLFKLRYGSVLQEMRLTHVADQAL